MKTFTATEAQNNFGILADTALTEPVSISRRGRVILELMTPEMKEKIIQERIKELVFEQFIDDAVASNQHFIETGLHLTQDEVKNWATSLTLNSKNPLPQCHT